MTDPSGVPFSGLVWAPLLVVLGGCVQQQAAPVSAPAPAPLEAAVIPGVTPAPGEPLALLAGGPILVPVVMPMWLDLQEDAQIDPLVHARTEATALMLDARRVYLEQSNLTCVHCTAKRACRVLELGTGELQEPGACVEAKASARRQLATLGAGWFTARTEEEGTISFALVAWSSEEGSRELLRLDLGPDDVVEVLRDSETSVVLRSACALPGGCAARRPMAIPEPKVYRFSEADGLREIR